MPSSDNDDDPNLFRRMMKDVTPLKKSIKTPRHHTPKSPIIKKRVIIESKSPEFFLSDPYDCTIGPETILSFNQQLPSKRFQQLKRGEIPVQGRLDLHGFRLSHARTTLSQFITDQCELGHRHILLIHGKGGVHNDIAILKSHINHWLRQIPLVIGFHSALPRDGGTGALYVLLNSKITNINES